MTTIQHLALSGLVTLALTTAAQAQSTTVNLFNNKSQRLGYGVVNQRTGTIDLYDTNSRRLGYGVLDRSSGSRVDLYTPQSKRLGYGDVRPAYRPGPSTGGR